MLGHGMGEGFGVYRAVTPPLTQPSTHPPHRSTPYTLPPTPHTPKHALTHPTPTAPNPPPPHPKGVLVANRRSLLERPGLLAIVRELLERFDAHLKAEQFYSGGGGGAFGCIAWV